MTNPKCPHCESDNIKKFGKVKTRKQSKKIQRFKCNSCKKTFTRRNFLPEYREKKPHLNKFILKGYTEGMPLRALGRVNNCHYKTSLRKFIKYGEIALEKNRKELLKNKTKCSIIQIDEMHTWIEKREQKLYIALAVSGWGQILSFRSGADRHKIMTEMLLDIKTFVSDKTIFFCDDEKMYINILEKIYPECDYLNMKGREADPYLSHLNFTCALVRNRLSRMNRKSWSFNRKNERLQLNLELLKSSFNQKFKAA